VNLKGLLFGLLIVFMITAVGGSTQRIKLMWTGRAVPGYPLHGWFVSEPLVDFYQVPSRDDLGVLGGEDEVRRFIRLYFPRAYDFIPHGFGEYYKSVMLRIFHAHLPVDYHQ
jgi:hypothetical protein